MKTRCFLKVSSKKVGRLAGSVSGFESKRRSRELFGQISHQLFIPRPLPVRGHKDSFLAGYEFAMNLNGIRVKDW